MTERQGNKGNKERDRAGMFLHVCYLIMIAATIPIAIKIIGIQTLFVPNPKIAAKLTPGKKRIKIEAARGNILAEDGRLLALTYPEFQIRLDCTVIKDDKEWNDSLADLSAGLSRILKDKTAAEYKATLKKGRDNGNKYLKIGNHIDILALEQIKQLPFLNRGRYKGGLLIEAKNKRHYPYGELGYRTIGHINETADSTSRTHIGLEGKFDYILHGKDGEMWLKESDFGAIQNFDSLYVKPEDGKDIRTTINIDYQSIADKALRNGIENEAEIEGGCVVLMEVATGAIRAMINLERDSKNGGRLGEIANLAIGRTGEPGSVFKSTNLMIMLENGHIRSLDETIPTNDGVLEGYGEYRPDVHITDYQKKHGNRIPIIEGFKVSSNYLFQYLVTKHYENCPENYISQLYTYHLGEAFDFDLEGLASPTLPNPKSKTWSKYDLTGAATGYAVDETPLHILMFYNAIAGKGRMMKPYLVESIEKAGEVESRRGPSILNASICSRATADTLTRGLKAVTEDGTAHKLKEARCPVAGKTGTSRVALKGGGYVRGNKKKNQGTFVGFFPADAPKYSIICVIYSYLSDKSFHGGNIPAEVVKEIVDKVYDIDPYWRVQLGKRADMPLMPSPIKQRGDNGQKEMTMPDVCGLGLKDAICLLENMGLKCTYSGVGHICSQNPEPGSKVETGTEVNVELL